MMEKITTSLLSFLLLGLMLQGCAEAPVIDDQADGAIVFTFSFPNETGGRLLAACDASITQMLLVTIHHDDNGEAGEVVFDGAISVTAFDGPLQSAKLSLPPGNYRLTRFEAYANEPFNQENLVGFVPKSGSPSQYFVDKTLDEIVFTTAPFSIVGVNVGLICQEVDEFIPETGLVNFPIEVVDVLALCIFANYCDPQNGDQVAKLRGSVFTASEAGWELIYEANNEDHSGGLLCLFTPFVPGQNDCFLIELEIAGDLYGAQLCNDFILNLLEQKGFLHLNQDCENTVPFVLLE